MFTNRILGCAAGFLLIVFHEVLPATEAQIGCGFEADGAWQQQVAAFQKTGTFRVLAIWAVADSSSNKKLPVFWQA